MINKEGKFNYRGLFAGSPDNVTIVQASDYRTFGTDRFSMWDLSAVCDAQGVDVPKPGRYKAMVKELRQTSDNPLLNGDECARLFDQLTAGIQRDPDDRLAMSEWANDHSRPIIHTRTADVRQIGVQWDAIPRLSTGTSWVACSDWEHNNVAVMWGMYEQAPFGTVQLVGSARASAEDWNMQPDMARAFANACDEVRWETVQARYPS